MDILTLFDFRMCKIDNLFDLLIFDHMVTIKKNVYELNAPDGLIDKLNNLFPSKIIYLDCSLFAQFMIQYLDNCDRLKYYFHYDCDLEIFADYKYIMNYIRPTSDDIYDALIKAKCDFMGVCVIELDDNKYLGLGSSTVEVKTLEEWVDFLYQEYQNWTKLEDDNNLEYMICTSRIKKNR